jgi:sensor c-di-GMP phosphodiesterase-like protein
MDFVADESCAKPVIQALREAGHDVVAIAEVAKGASDDQVLECALKVSLSRKTAISANWFTREDAHQPA